MSEQEPDEEWETSYDGEIFDDCDLVSPEDEEILNGLFSQAKRHSEELVRYGRK